jgi:hypothetical protein
VIPEVFEDQLDPLLVLKRIVPLAPTATHSEVDGHDTPYNVFDVPEVLDDQLDPLFVVATILPLAPTPKQSADAGHEIAWRAVVRPEVWLDQLDPPLVVAWITPPLPSTMQFDDDAHATPFNCCVVPELWLDQVSANAADTQANETTTMTATTSLRGLTTPTRLMTGAPSPRELRSRWVIDLSVHDWSR